MDVTDFRQKAVRRKTADGSDPRRGARRFRERFVELRSESRDGTVGLLERQARAQLSNLGNYWWRGLRVAVQLQGSPHLNVA
jgi:hypothetical protein